MQPTPLLPVVDDVFRWSVWNEPRKLWFNGHALRMGGALVLVDPVEMSDEVVAALGAIGTVGAPGATGAGLAPVLCVITNKDHERAGAQARERFGARVLVPSADAAAMTLAGDAMEAGDELLPGLAAVAVADGKTPGETALYWRPRRLLILGDAAVGRPAGALSMLPSDRFADVEAARRGVARLAELEPVLILVGDGEDLLSGGAAALRALGQGPAKAPLALGKAGC
jgi:glyoxylase-like metal-dependent hydrolase (beta-lactamase superfamily II)